MPFLSEFLGRAVWDSEGQRVGKLDDLLASAAPVETPYPPIVALVVEQGEAIMLIPWDQVRVMVGPVIALGVKAEAITPYLPAEHDLYLARDILDKQVIDINGLQVVRVNDLELTKIDGRYYLTNVDIGGQGLLRRLGLDKLAAKIAQRLKRPLPERFIAWNEVELLPTHGVRLKVPRSKIAELHPADIAEILSDLTPRAGEALIGSLDNEMVADTLEEFEPEFQASMLNIFDDERAADVLEAMTPDDAADLLGELPPERREELLRLMEEEEEEEVRELLAYAEDTAGGLMTTEYVTVPPEITAAQAIELLREEARKAETIFYVYVVDGEEHLLGVFSLRELILAQPGAKVADFMERKVIKVGLETPSKEVVRVMAKYDLLAVPVVDEGNRLQGMVTADDAVDLILPEEWKVRLPRIF
jgi:CBS domain-containing protein/sporulation protein YlmC with PRC-barrel domain